MTIDPGGSSHTKKPGNDTLSCGLLISETIDYSLAFLRDAVSLLPYPPLRTIGSTSFSFIMRVIPKEKWKRTEIPLSQLAVTSSIKDGKSGRHIHDWALNVCGVRIHGFAARHFWIEPSLNPWWSLRGRSWRNQSLLWSTVIFFLWKGFRIQRILSEIP